MDNEEILENEDEESGILTLTDENGVETDFEYLDCIPYEGKEYLLLLPADEAATDVVILEVEPVDEETENYISVQDEAILNAVYDITFVEESDSTRTSTAIDEIKDLLGDKGCYVGMAVQNKSMTESLASEMS